MFLLSMRSGAVGINLTAANHVFILEPCMNPALEDQACARCTLLFTVQWHMRLFAFNFDATHYSRLWAAPSAWASSALWS